MAERSAICNAHGQRLHGTMGVRLNEWGLRYDDLRDIFDKYKTDEASFHSHLLEAGVARRPWRSKLWQHFSKKQSSL